jgi:hypothetical protein
MQVVHVSRGLISGSNSGQDDVARNEYIYPPRGKVPPFNPDNLSFVSSPSDFRSWHLGRHQVRIQLLRDI